MIPIHPTLSLPNILATFMVAISAVSDQSQSQMQIHHHISVIDSCSFVKTTDRHLWAREENKCPKPWQTPSSSLESLAASTITAPTFLPHFPSSKRHGPDPTGIYEHLTTDFTDLLLTWQQTWLKPNWSC